MARDAGESHPGTQTFLDLRVADFPRSIAFFVAPGCSHDPPFRVDDGACIVVGDAIPVLPPTHARLRDFTPKPVDMRSMPARE